MGDAYLPIGDDPPSGLFYNPANLGRIRKTQIEPLNFSGYLNSPLITVSGTSFYNGSSLSSRLQLGISWWTDSGHRWLSRFKLWFLGVCDGRFGAVPYDGSANVDTTLSYRSLYQFIPALGYGYRFLGGALRVGYSLQWVNEALGSPTVANSGSLGFDQGLNQGSGFSHTAGLALMLPISNCRNLISWFEMLSTLIIQLLLLILS